MASLPALMTSKTALVLAALSVGSLLLNDCAFAEDTPATTLACEALLNPHVSIAKLLPQVSDEDALRLLKANYSELLTWLSQKADATAEGSSATPKGAFGPEHDQTPSMLLFGRNIVEVDRTSVGILALKWILAGDYARFTQNQAPPVRLSVESFAELRKYVLSVLRTPEDVDAMIVMILTNDLGKIKRYHDLAERASGRAIVDHDEVLFVGFNEWPETSPNFNRLAQVHRDQIIDGLQMGASLNVGQFAQAENLPANLAGVKALAGKPNAFEFKFIELLLDVAGANGHMDSGGAKVMIEPVFRNFVLARRALLEVIDGKSLREAYDQILITKADMLAAKGFRHLDVQAPEERAILRLLTLRRTTDERQAAELLSVYEALPPNARAILSAELNVDGVSDGWGVLPYYAPALIDNALRSLAPTGPEGSKAALRTTLLALARTFQEARIQLRGRGGNGVLTVNVEALASYVKTEAYQTNPDSLLSQEFELVQHQGDPNQYFVKLSALPKIDVMGFPRLAGLSQLQGLRILFVGIGGGSDVIQAAMLAKLASGSGKQAVGLVSVRTSRTASQGADGKIDEERKYTAVTPVEHNLFKVSAQTTGPGRVLEAIVADELPTYLFLDEGLPVSGDSSSGSHDTLTTQIGRAMAAMESMAYDSIVLVDTGGDSLYRAPSASGLNTPGKTTPDQDLRVLRGFVDWHRGAGSRVNLYSAIVAAGVDSPSYAEQVLKDAGASYYELSPSEQVEVTAQYQSWKMDGSDDSRFGKTPLAWLAALRGEAGVTTIPLPARVVLDRKNPWNPFVRVPASGVFFMDADRHLEKL